MQLVQLAGHLGADVETRFTPDGQKVSSFRLAVNTRRGGKDETTWWRVTIWGDRFDKMFPYLKKGSGIIVVGEFVKVDTYTDREGKQQVALEVRAEMLKFSPFGRSGQDGQSGSGATETKGSEYTQAPAPRSYGTAPQQTPSAQAGRASDFEADIPF